MRGLAADTSAPLTIAVVGAALAALGYVAKLIVAEWNQARIARNARRTSLIRLQALLRAAKTAFDVQAKLRDQLFEELRLRQPSKVPHGLAIEGYEQLFTELFPVFSDEQRELHLVIRAYTEHALRPVNEGLLRWLREDTDHRTPRPRAGPDENELAVKLNQLDTHLMLWLAKFSAWIPDHPEHALNYTNDEKRHGAAFPTGIDGVLDRVLKAQGIVIPVERGNPASAGAGR